MPISGRGGSPIAKTAPCSPQSFHEGFSVRPSIAYDRALPRLAPRRRLELALDQSVREFTEDGFLRVHRTILSEATISPYVGIEVPGYRELGLDPNRKYLLLRAPDELHKATATFNSLPLLFGHRPLSADDLPHELIVGCTGSEAAFDGRYLSNSITIWSAPAIEAVESGEAADLSMAYRYRPVIQPLTFRGQRADGFMTDIIGQHASLVDDGRVPSAKVAA